MEVSQPLIANKRFRTLLVSQSRLLFSQFTHPLTGGGPGCPARVCAKPRGGRLGLGEPLYKCYGSRSACHYGGLGACLPRSRTQSFPAPRDVP